MLTTGAWRTLATSVKDVDTERANRFAWIDRKVRELRAKGYSDREIWFLMRYAMEAAK